MPNSRHMKKWFLPEGLCPSLLCPEERRNSFTHWCSTPPAGGDPPQPGSGLSLNVLCYGPCSGLDDVRTLDQWSVGVQKLWRGAEDWISIFTFIWSFVICLELGFNCWSKFTSPYVAYQSNGLSTVNRFFLSEKKLIIYWNMYSMGTIRAAPLLLYFSMTANPARKKHLG